MAKSSIPNSYFNFLDRSLSEDLLGDDDLEAFLSDLERRTEGRIDVRSIWDYISSRSELNCSLQFTKLYEPINSEQFLVGQTEMEQVRASRTVQTDNCESLFGGQSGWLFKRLWIGSKDGEQLLIQEMEGMEVKKKNQLQNVCFYLELLVRFMVFEW